MSEFKDGDYVRIINEKSADFGKTGQVFRAYKVHVLVTFDGRYATLFDYADIAPDDTPSVSVSHNTATFSLFSIANSTLLAA